MKTRKPESLEKGWVLWTTLKSLVLSGALLWALVWSPTEWSAKTKSDMPEWGKVTEVTQQKQEIDTTKTSPLTDLGLWSWTWIKSSEDDPIKFEPDPGLKPHKKIKVWDKVEAEDLIDLSQYPEGTTAEFVEGYEVDTTQAKKWVETAILVSIPGETAEIVLVRVDVEDKLELQGGLDRLQVHGFVQVWTSVVPDFAGIFSDKVSGMVCIDAKDKGTWLWLTIVRLDDFHTDPKYPLSRASVVVPYWTISSKDGKRSGWASVEFSFIDQMPGSVGVTPVIVWSYSDSGWTIEWKYFHDFQEWKDMDAVRLWITKKIWKILSLTAQWWYKSDYAGKVYGRVIADVDLWGWFWAQLSCIAKDWKLIPTWWVMYRF